MGQHAIIVIKNENEEYLQYYVNGDTMIISGTAFYS